MSAPEPRTRWTEEPWAWLVLGIPVGTVVACALLFTIAARHRDGLVVDDYYKRGLAINEVLDREARAAALGLAVEVTALGGPTVEFTLRWDAAADTLPATVDVLLAHATRDRGDQALVAAHLGDGRYRAAAAPLAPGPWYVDVTTAEWRIMTRRVVARGAR